MKNKFFAIALLSILSAPTFAVDNPYYVGVSAGSANYSGIASTSGTAVGGFFGYKLNDRFAVEAQYTSLGSPTLISYSDGLGTMTGSASVSSIGVDAVYSWPLAKDFSVFGKLGYANNTISASCSGTGAYTGYSCGSVALASTGLDYGLGLQYMVTSNIGVRGGYQVYEADISALYVAGLFSF